MNLFTEINQIPKITKPQIAVLKKLGINTIENLLWHLPYRYLDFTQTKKITKLVLDENVSLKVKIKSISSRFSFKSKISLCEAVVSDETGTIKIIWFNQPYLAKSLKPNDEIYIAGKAEYYNFSLQFLNPIYEKVSDFNKHTARLVPLYHLKKDIYPKTFRNLIANILPFSKEIAETLPKEILFSQNLLNLPETIKQLHFPDSAQSLNEAKKRLAFEEIFENQLLAQRHKLILNQKQSFSIKFSEEIVKSFLKRLPFTLTPDQKKSAWDILKDIEKTTPMNRLLEGDVGSGKTLVALMAGIECVAKALQVVFLAPTEILAKQHFETAKKYLLNPPLNFNTRCILLTQNYCQINIKEKKRKEVLEEIALGMPGIIFGTHALLQKEVNFKKLALVIIDEQHRFGVHQRAYLIKQKDKIPHLLSLSATPIPRSLKLAFFGELDISQIRQKPNERKPIITKLINNENRSKAYEFIRNEIKKGRQIFVITPLVEEGKSQETKSAKKELENIKRIFPEFKIGLLYGKMKSDEKEQVMSDFLLNNISILVSTSVVEVGVDVPNASVMLIEGADRFGLAQLHQFRGRVGRSGHQSFCMLFTETKNPESLERLQKFTKTQDGFLLAEIDLKERGFGDLYGENQSGWNFKYFDSNYTNLIPKAKEEALKILQNDWDLVSLPLIRDKILNSTIHFE